MIRKQASDLAPRAGLEPPALCLGGKPSDSRRGPATVSVMLTWRNSRQTPADVAVCLPVLALSLALQD
jgi:hypothetical protein